MRTRLLVLFVLSVALPAAAEAQLCKANETVTGCVNRLLDDRGTAEGAAKATAASAAKNTEAGVFDPGNGLSSSVKDFLPLLQLSGLIGPVQTDDSTGVITVAINPVLTGKDKHTQLRAVINTKGKLYGPLKSQLTKDVAEALEKKLTTEKDRQNVTLEFSYNYTSRRFGRDYAPFDDLLGQLLLAAARRPTVLAANTALRDAAIALATEMQKLGIQIDDVFSQFETNRSTIEGLIANRVEASRASEAALAAVIKSTGINRYGPLLVNRPQLHFAASRSWRDALYGPNELHVRVTYEAGVGQGFNRFLSRVKGLDCTKEFERCLAEFQRIATAADVSAQLKAGSRFSMFFEVHQFNRYEAPADVSPFTSPKIPTFAAGATLGRLVGVSDTGVAQGRLDFAVKWERPKDRSVAKDHTRASITFTKKIGDVSVPFGLVWANRPEFLDPESYDHGLTARVGLKFNLFPPLR